MKDKFDENMLKELKEKVMEDLVDKYVLLVKADELDIKVSDREFGDFFNSIEAFKKDGKFNNEQYRQSSEARTLILRNLRRPGRRIEEHRRSPQLFRIRVTFSMNPMYGRAM